MLFFSGCSGVFSQDTIVLKNSSKIPVSIEEIGDAEIRYSNYLDRDAPSFAISRSDVDYIVYADGFTEKMTAPAGETPAVSPRELYRQGEADAIRYYNGYKGARTGTLVVSLLSPLVGLVPAIACSATTPNDINLCYPDTQLFHNPDYQHGYIRQSRRIKSGKVWTNWFVAFGVNVVLVLVMQGSAN